MNYFKPKYGLYQQTNTDTEKSDMRTRKVQISIKCMRKTTSIYQRTQITRKTVTFMDSKRTVAFNSCQSHKAETDAIFVQTRRYNTGHVSSALALTHTFWLWKTRIILDNNLLSFLQVLLSPQEIFCLV